MVQMALNLQSRGHGFNWPHCFQVMILHKLFTHVLVCTINFACVNKQYYCSLGSTLVFQAPQYAAALVHFYDIQSCLLVGSLKTLVFISFCDQVLCLLYCCYCYYK